MLGSQQLSDLLSWLSHPEPDNVRFKILVSSIPFTRNWRVNAQDTWGGYLSERRKILQAMWSVNTNQTKPLRVIVLSGDRHEFAATRFPVIETADNEAEEGANDVYEFSTSPLSMFYLPTRTYWEDGEEGRWVGKTLEEIRRVGLGEKQHASIGEEWGRDEKVMYIPDGNSKFAALDLRDDLVSGRGVCTFRLFVDGKEAWPF